MWLKEIQGLDDDSLGVCIKHICGHLVWYYFKESADLDAAGSVLRGVECPECKYKEKEKIG